MCDPSTPASMLQGWPLCCNYALVLVEALRVEKQDDAGARSDLTLRWAFGVLADGQLEVLDAWEMPVSDSAAWQRKLEDFKERGVESISALATCKPHMPLAALRAVYPSAALLPNSGQAMLPSDDLQTGAEKADGFALSPDSAGTAIFGAASKDASSADGEAVLQKRVGFRWHDHFEILPQRHLRTSLASRLDVEKIRSSVVRSISRHGPFSQIGEATAFVLDASRRAELKLDAETIGRYAVRYGCPPTNRRCESSAVASAVVGMSRSE